MDASRRLSRLLASLALVVAVAAPAAAQNTGVLLFTDKEQIPLKTYAEFMRSGILRITSGAVKDIPTDRFVPVHPLQQNWMAARLGDGGVRRPVQERVPRAAADSDRDAAGGRDRRHGARRRP